MEIALRRISNCVDGKLELSHLGLTLRLCIEHSKCNPR